MPKEKNMKCGFCDNIIEDFKELGTISKGRRRIKTCPFCNSVLGMFYVSS